MRKFYLFLLIFFAISNTLLAQEKQKIKVGVLPILDVLPIYVAQKEGYFDKVKAEIEILSCASASERDQLLASENLDIVVNDLLSIALFNKEKTNVFGIRDAMLPTKKYPQFYILSSKKSGIRGPLQLKNIPIGISEGTIIHYITERLLEKRGLKKEEIKTIPIPRIPDRLSALIKGDIKAATLPDPFGILAVMEGATVVLDDSIERSFSGSLYSVRKGFMERNPEIVKAFLESIDEAIENINRDKNRWSNLIVEKRLVPSPLSGSYRIPDFPKRGIPDRKKWMDVIEWLKEKGLIKVSIPYEKSIRENL